MLGINLKWDIIFSLPLFLLEILSSINYATENIIVSSFLSLLSSQLYNQMHTLYKIYFHHSHTIHMHTHTTKHTYYAIKQEQEYLSVLSILQTKKGLYAVSTY